MSHSPAARQRYILDQLSLRQGLTIQELAAELGVSAMTIHRDLSRLAASGKITRTRGGAALPMRTSSHSPAPGLCAMCNRPVPERSAVILQSQQLGRLTACCPHCGLALLEHDTSASLMLVTDFLHQQMVSAHDASFVVGSAVWSCCTPGILAFAGRDDAERFQRGFGGDVMSFAQVRYHVRDSASVGSES